MKLQKRAFPKLIPLLAALVLCLPAPSIADQKSPGHNSKKTLSAKKAIKQPAKKKVIKSLITKQALKSSAIAIGGEKKEFLATANFASNSVTIFKIAKNGPVKITEVAVGVEPRYVAFGTLGKELFVSNAQSGSVSVIALKGDKKFQLIKEIPVAPELRGLVLSPNGKFVFVAAHTSGKVFRINTKTKKVDLELTVGRNPTGLAITNDADGSDLDEKVYVTDFYAESIAGAASEAIDTGKRGVVHVFTTNGSTAPTKITLSALSNAGFTADRSAFCTKLNSSAASDLFCPDPNSTDPNDPAIKQVAQGAFPNQLYSILVTPSGVLVPSIAAQPEPPVKFNLNLQALVHTIERTFFREDATKTININEQIKAETQPVPAEGSLVRAFAGDIVDIASDLSAKTILLLSRGGNYAMRASIATDGKLTISAPNVIRFQTGNLPTGVVINEKGSRAYVYNEIGRSVTEINLQSNQVLQRDIEASVLPATGSTEHIRSLGKLAFFTSMGMPESSLASTAIRAINPVQHRNKASDNSWSSCGSCHPDGLADGVTWIFATGPRQTIPLDGMFNKLNPSDQRITNFSAVQGSIVDFNGNARNVQGGTGFAGNPPNAQIFNHGRSSGVSESLDAMTHWVQTVRALNMPQSSQAQLARDLFDNNCASCHGGAKWTKSEVVYVNNPTFNINPAQGGVAFDPGILNAGPQIRSYTLLSSSINFLDSVGTFDITAPLEVRSDATRALGALGFNAPSLLGTGYHAPYLHDGSAQDLDQLFSKHTLGSATIANTFSAEQLSQLKALLNSIDANTTPFKSDMDLFKESLAP